MRGELKTALKRVEDLQVAISGDIDSDSYSDQVECSETAWRTRTSWPAAQWSATGLPAEMLKHISML